MAAESGRDEPGGTASGHGGSSRGSSFDDRAADWDTPDKIDRARGVARAIRGALPTLRGMRAIELGAGTGLLGLELVDALGELVLSDPSTGMLAVAEAKIRDRGLHNVRTVRLDVVTDQLPEPGFDLVLSLLMLHHVRDTAHALRAASSLLRPGGWLALADLDREDGSFHDPSAEGIHHRGFDRTTLLALAAAAGLTEIDVRTATEIEREGRRYPLFLLTARRPDVPRSAAGPAPAPGTG